MELSSDELDNNESSLDKSNFDKEIRVIGDNRKSESIYNSLKDNK